MSSLCMIYIALALVLVSSQECHAACNSDVTCERSVPGKVITRFLKVPWINLESSWKDQVETDCRNDVTSLFESADAGDMWALQMLDAASKIPSGILMSNIVDLGQYDQCVGVKGHENRENIEGQHCMVSLALPSKFVENVSTVLYVQRLSIINPTVDVDPSLTLSVCLPSSCTVKDVVGFANASIQNNPDLVEFEVSVAHVTCSGVESADNFTMGTILTISFFVVIASVLLSCTVCDFLVRTKSENTSLTLKTLARFSLYTNAIELLNTEKTSGTMPAVHGMRFLSMCCILIHHKGFLTLMHPLVNLSDFYKLRQTVMGSLNFMTLYTVDTFFIISGFLVTYSFLRKLQSGVKYSTLQFYIHRYIRLTPCVGVLILFTVFIVPHLGSGPIWQILSEGAIDNCRKNWWANMLFIQNLASGEKMCLPHTWHLAVEMQFFLICPIILYPLFHRPRLGLTILGVFSIAALIIPAIQILENNCSFLFSTTKIRAESVADFYNTYIITYNRALPYLIGIFLGYVVVNNKRQLTEMQVAVNWILTCVFILLCSWNTHFIQPNAFEYNLVAEAVYVSLGRLGWSLAMAWTLYACTQGYGGRVTWLLSLPIFTPLSRMTYGIYLIHLGIQVSINAMKRTAEYYSLFGVLHLVWGDLVICIVLSFILNVCIETPAIILEDVIRNKQKMNKPTAVIKSASMKSNMEFSAIMDKYLDLTNGQVGSDLALEMRMQQLDFWRSISEMLNTLGKGPIKSHAEWAKTWWNWREDYTQRKTHADDRKNESTQFQTRVPTLDQELLIFLVAAMCGLDDNAAFKKSDIIEPAKPCQLDSFYSDNGDIVQSSVLDSTSFTKKTS